MNVGDATRFFSFFFWALFTYSSHFFAKQFFSVSDASTRVEQVVFLTTLQVGCGAILFLLLRIRGRGGGPPLDYKLILLGACHSYGMLMTNSSMSQTTASLTHLIKMSEPFYTTIIMAVMGKINFNFKILLIMIIILVTAAGSEPITEASSSMVGIGFALASNLFYALRNIGTKYFYPEDSSKSATTLDGFASISVGGLISLIPAWVVSYIFGFDKFIDITDIDESNLNYIIFISATSHALYNIISLTIILAYFNPVQHAMLNVGKRTSIVLVFYIFSQRPFTVFNLISAVICLTVSVVGVQTLAAKKQSSTGEKSEDLSWKHLAFGVAILIISLSSLSWLVSNTNTGKI